MPARSNHRGVDMDTESIKSGRSAAPAEPPQDVSLSDLLAAIKSQGFSLHSTVW
jgi:hypothetical protein